MRQFSFVNFFESFHEDTDRPRMILTFQNRIILNTFSRQPIKTMQGNIMWLSNFHLHMFTNVLKFWCYDPNLSSSGQARFCRSLPDSQLLNVYRVFFCLKLETNLAVSCLETQNAFLCNPSFLFFFTGWNKRYFSVLFNFYRGSKRRKITICGNGSEKSS